MTGSQLVAPKSVGSPGTASGDDVDSAADDFQNGSNSNGAADAVKVIFADCYQQQDFSKLGAFLKESTLLSVG